MNQAAISRGKEIIKEAIRLAQPGEVAQIPVADRENLTLFERALRHPDIQRMLIQKGVTVEFYIPEAVVEQAKKHMLQVIRTASDEIEQIVFPYLPQDYKEAEIALSSTEVQTALRSRGMTAVLQIVPQKGEIIVASIDQAINGDLDNFLRKHNK